MKCKTISSLEKYIAFVESLRRDHGRPLWYRGCGKLSYRLKPSLYRHKMSKNIEDYMRFEKQLIERFRQRSIPFLQRPATDPWEWLFLMQHYGVPTRLLDWSESPLTALFFAVTMAPHTLSIQGKPIFRSDAAIWLLDPVEWNKKSVNLKSFQGTVITVDDAYANAYRPSADTSTMKDYPIAIYGSHNSQRIVAQRGVFVCFGKDTRSMDTIYDSEHFPNDCLVKASISRDRLPNVYDALRQNGLTDSVVFPDLDGLAREIKRYYGFEV